NRFIRSLIRWELATRHLVLVNAYDVQTAGRVDNIRTGVTILDKAEYELLRGLKAGFGSKLNRFNNAEASPDNMQIAGSVLLLDEPWKFYRASFVGWSDEAVNIFAGELAKTDKRIADTDSLHCVGMAFSWAHEHGFFQKAGEDVWEGIKENKWIMLGTLVGILVAQAIPGLNIALDFVLAIEFGLSAIDAAFSVGRALKNAGGANSVVQMEHAAAGLATVLVGTAAEIAMWAATWGVM